MEGKHGRRGWIWEREGDSEGITVSVYRERQSIHKSITRTSKRHQYLFHGDLWSGQAHEWQVTAPFIPHRSDRSLLVVLTTTLAFVMPVLSGLSVVEAQSA